MSYGPQWGQNWELDSPTWTVKMPYVTRAKNGKKILVLDLTLDRQNWPNYREKLFQAAEAQDSLRLLNGTKTKPNEPWDPWHTAAWMRNDTEVQYLVIMTTPPTLHDHLSLSMTVHEVFKTLHALLEKRTTTTTTVHNVQHNNTTLVAARASDGLRNRSGRQWDNSLSNGTCCEHEHGTTDHWQVRRKRQVDAEKGKKLHRRVEEGAATESALGMETTDQSADGIGLATPASSPTAGWQVNKKTTDTINLNMTSAGPTEPADRSPGPAVKPEPPQCKLYTTSHNRTLLSEDTLGGEAQEVAMSWEGAMGDEVEGGEMDDEDCRAHKRTDNERSRRVETSEDETIMTTTSTSTPSVSCDHQMRTSWGQTQKDRQETLRTQWATTSVVQMHPQSHLTYLPVRAQGGKGAGKATRQRCPSWGHREPLRRVQVR